MIWSHQVLITRTFANINQAYVLAPVPAQTYEDFSTPLSHVGKHLYQSELGADPLSLIAVSLTSSGWSSHQSVGGLDLSTVTVLPYVFPLVDYFLYIVPLYSRIRLVSFKWPMAVQDVINRWQAYSN